MGQRANYILKKKDSLDIYYHHWRANTIASDLYLGENKFLDFVKSCTKVDEFLTEIWMEGCVIVDFENKILGFWYWEFPKETSIQNYYLEKLSQNWENWSIKLLKNRMHEAENLFNLGYNLDQERIEPNKMTKEEIERDKINDWETALIIIKSGNKTYVTKTGNIGIEFFISYGREIIPLVKSKTQFKFENENEIKTYEVIFVDEELNKIIINESCFGLWEQCKALWKGYNLIMGDFGYLEVLKLAGIEAGGLVMSIENILKSFHDLIKIHDDFDPITLAQQLKMEMGNDIEFNSNFFNNPKPKQNFLQKIKTIFKLK